jgi:hypothetical protein
MMNLLARISFFAFVAAFAFTACETKHTENAAETTTESIKADIEASADSLEANTEQAVEAAGEAVDAAGEKVKEETREAAGDLKD